MEHDIHQLTERVAAGDPEAFTAFYREWFDFMERAAAAAAGLRGRDEALRLDIVHDAMVRIIRSIPALSSHRDLERWLTAVVKSCAYDLLRRERRRAKREAAHAETRRESSDVGIEAELNDQLAWLRAELASLDAPRMTLLRMRHQLGWSLARIGQSLGVGHGAVDGRLSRLIEELRARAGEDQC